MKSIHSITSQLVLCTWWYFAPEKSSKGLQHCAVTDQQKSKTDCTRINQIERIWAAFVQHTPRIIQDFSNADYSI